MTDHSQLAKKYFLDGCNCAQAVVLAYSEDIGLDKSACLRLASSFGGGMGKLREVCGAVSGMLMVAGILMGYDDINNPDAKAEHYQFVRDLAAQFKEKNGSIICRELLGIAPDGQPPEARTAEYYEKRPCANLVECAAVILDSVIK